MADDQRIDIGQGICLLGLEGIQTCPKRLDRVYRPFHELNVETARRIPLRTGHFLGEWVAQVVEIGDPLDRGNHLLQKLEAFRHQRRNPAVDTRQSPPGIPEALYETKAHGIGTRIKDDGDILCRTLDSDCDRSGNRIDYVDVLSFQVPCCGFHQIPVPVEIPHMQNKLPAFFQPQMLQPVPQAINGFQVPATQHDDSDLMDAGLLCPKGMRRGEQQAGGDHESPSPDDSHGVLHSIRTSEQLYTFAVAVERNTTTLGRELFNSATVRVGSIRAVRISPKRTLGGGADLAGGSDC